MKTNMAPSLYNKFSAASNNPKPLAKTSKTKNQTGFFVRPEPSSKKEESESPYDITENAMAIFRSIRNRRNIS